LEGYEGRAAVLDHIVVDFKIIQKYCTAFTITDYCISDHTPVILNMELGVTVAPVPKSYYQQVIDVEKLTLHAKLEIQNKLCKEILDIEDVIEDIIRGDGEENRI
jgi:hypothetical protein